MFRWRSGDGGADVTSLVRTSAAAGLVTFWYSSTFVTSDGGAHWYVVDGPPNDPAVGDEVVGHGPLLFGSRGDTIYRAVEWPATHLHCGGRWYHVVQSPIGDVGPAPRNICLGGPGAAVHTLALFSDAGGRSLRVRALTAAGLVYDVFDDAGAHVVETDTLPVQRPDESWADRDHGWRTGDAGLEATSDGGHTWRLVLRVERSSGGDVVGPLRTSASAGVVGVSNREFVTNDAGRHWYQASIAGPGRLFGRGSLLYAAGGPTISQAVRWPLPQLRCRGRWVHSAEYFNLLSAGPRPRTICLQDTGASVPMKVVYRVPVPTWTIVGRHLVGGVLSADVYDDDGTYDTPLVGSVTVRDGVASAEGQPSPMRAPRSTPTTPPTAPKSSDSTPSELAPQTVGT